MAIIDRASFASDDESWEFDHAVYTHSIFHILNMYPPDAILSHPAVQAFGDEADCDTERARQFFINGFVGVDVVALESFTHQVSKFVLASAIAKHELDYSRSDELSDESYWKVLCEVAKVACGNDVVPIAAELPINVELIPVPHVPSPRKL